VHVQHTVPMLQQTRQIVPNPALPGNWQKHFQAVWP